MKRYLRNEDGGVPFIPFFVMALVILLVMIMTWAAAEINCIRVRNTLKSEMTVVSVRIAEDTYKAMREGNIDEYYRTLTEDDSYRTGLRDLARSGIANAMPLETDNYKVENIDLTFREHPDSIEYVLTCDVEYYVSLFGDSRTIRSEEVEISGKHNIKGY